MPYGFLDLLATPSVQAAQRDNGSRRQWEDFSGDRAFDRFTENEAAFIAARDSFYLASISESGWPYVQHRGGPVGFVKILDDKTLGFADFRGNRQYLSLGNIAADNRIALILMDYPNRARLKILGRLTAHDLTQDPDLGERLREDFELGLGVVDVTPGAPEAAALIAARVERALTRIDKKRITLNPDCGFAPGSAAKVDTDEVYMKLKAEAEAARMLRAKYA